MKSKIKTINYETYYLALKGFLQFCENANDICSERHMLYVMMLDTFMDMDISQDDIVDKIYSDNKIDKLMKNRQSRDFYEDAMRALSYMHMESKIDKAYTDIVDGDGEHLKEVLMKLYEQKV